MSDEQKAVEQWLDEVVIGLNLCPFAAKPRSQNQVRFMVSQAQTEQELLYDLHTEIQLLEQTPPTEIETTLLIIPFLLADFEDYNQFLDIVDAVLDDFNWHGEFQIASFHPHYCFADTQIDSIENFTNRSPYPILHIIREQSMEKALAHMAAPDEIFKRNITTMNNLSTEQIAKLFPYLN